jgi:putative GTP pyrophosphokinase
VAENQFESGLTPEEWGDRYSDVRERHENFAEDLQELLSDLLRLGSVDAEAVEARAKTVDSFVEKVREKGDKYPNPVSDIPDLVGARVVTSLLDDVLEVRKILENNFEIDWDRSSIGGYRDPDRFGYVSDHYEVRLDSKRAEMPEWKEFADLWAEIQVRTVPQHAWAVVSHRLQYKAEREVPREHRRQLSRISALLEVADKEFSELTEATAQLGADYAAAIEEGNLDLEINADSLAAFLKVTQRHMHYSRVAEELGYARFGELIDKRAADWTLANFHGFVDLVLYGSDVVEQSTLTHLDEVVPEPAPDHIRAGIREIFEKTERGFLPIALPISMLSLGYAISLREYLDPEDVMLILNLPIGLSVGLESALNNPPAAG